MTHTAESLAEAFHYLYPNEVKALKQLARMLPDNPTVVNIGAGAGTSGLAFMESREDLRLITIDKESGDSPLGSLLSEENALKEAGLWNDRVTHKQGDSQEIGNDWFMERVIAITRGFGYRSADLVFIDADHSYEGCRGDIMAWLPNVRTGGILAIHDYRKHEIADTGEANPKPWPGVDQAVDEMLVGKYEQILRVDSLVAFRV